jgi:hypothetical protein
LAEAGERDGVALGRKKGEIDNAARAGKDSVRERSFVGKGAQLRKKSAHAAGEKRDFENGGGGAGFKKERDRLTEVVPEVGALGFVEGRKLDIFDFGESGEMGDVAGGAVAYFRRAFDADAEMPGIDGKFSLKGRERRVRRILFGFEEKLHELRTDEVNGGGLESGVFNVSPEGECVFGSAGRSHESAAGRRNRKGAEV